MKVRGKVKVGRPALGCYEEASAVGPVAADVRRLERSESEGESESESEREDPAS